VEVRRELSSVDPRPGIADLGAGPSRDRPDRRKSVVYLETAPQRAFEDHERVRAVLDQRNEAFVPYVLAITLGTTVDFPNSDRTYHNVFSFSKPRRFDLGRYGRGESKSVRFDKPGVVRVFCEIHSHMSAFILVFAHRFFATTDAEGRYRIDDVPSGTYTLAAWNDGEVRDTRPVRVPEGSATEQDFVVR
jgi:plastocyanin